jgi:hypothetical protein
MAAVEKLTDQPLLADIAKYDIDRIVREAAIKKLTNQSVLADIGKTDSNSDVRIVAARKLVEFDLKEDLLMVLIGMLGNELKSSESKSTKENAADVFLDFYRRYGKSKHGKEIRMYEGTHGYSDHTDYHTDEEDCRFHICSGHTDSHDDSHTDTLVSVKFNNKET